MTRKFSLAHLTVLGCAPPEMTYLAARAGYDLVSYRLIFMGLPGEPDYALAGNEQMRRETRAALRATGLGVSDIELARIHDGVDVRSYLPAMEVAAELGARSVITSVWTADRTFALAAYAELCDLARPLGLTVDLEFPTWSSLTTLQEAVEVVRAAKRENAGILVDMLHFHRSRAAPAELEAVPRSWFHLAHLCDAPAAIPATRDELIHTGRDERLYVGEGGIDVAGILARMPEVPCAIELPHLARVREYGYEEHARRCLETARRYLAAHAQPAPDQVTRR
jgi:sugar phosphate isomerase/epimerase